MAAILAVGEKLAGSQVRHLLVHCYAGVSRSTAAAIGLMSQRNPGREADIFAALADIRPRAWPNTVLVGHADRLLGRGGALVEALRLRSEEHTSELQSLMRISYAVFCLKTKTHTSHKSNT